MTHMLFTDTAGTTCTAGRLSAEGGAGWWGRGWGQVRRPLQYLSLLGWLPAVDAANIFRFDSAVNKYKLEQARP